MNADDSNSDPLSEKLFDLFLYAPLGLMLDAETIAPDFAKRGRQHRVAARHLGELAVKRGLGRVEGLLRQFQADERRLGEHSSSLGDVSAGSEPLQPSPGQESKIPAAADLAIPEYEGLAASHLVKPLGALSGHELEAARIYETATRSRRTILAKIARLQTP